MKGKTHDKKYQYAWEPKLKKELAQVLNSEMTGHGFDHAERVVRLCIEIVRRGKMNVDTEMLTAAAFLHDVGYALIDIPKDPSVQHIQKGTAFAQVILPKVGFPKEKISSVLFLIEHHDDFKRTVWNDWEKGKKNSPMHFLPLCVLQDADLLDALGAIGVGRCFFYSAKILRHMVNHHPRMPKKAQAKADNVEKSAFDIFLEYHLKAVRWMHFPMTRMWARERVSFIRGYLKEISRELSELGFRK